MAFFMDGEKHLIYTDNLITDRNNILRYVDDFVGQIKMTDVQVDSVQIYSVCLRIRNEHCYIDGLKNASVFKKMANFVSIFIEESPIKADFQPNIIPSLTRCNINAIVAFDIALACLFNSQIVLKNGEAKIVSKPLYLSNHSYIDIIDALSQEKIKQTTHFHMLAVLFEQITYKTNNHCEYKPEDECESSNKQQKCEQTFYGYNDGGDDLWGI
jgi:hypothetical protein